MPKRRLGELRELRQRLAFAERLLTGVAEANNSLLNIRDYRESIQTSLEILGRSTQVDRVYIFQCHDDPSSGAHLSSQKWEWVAEGIEPEIDNPALQNLSFDDFLPRWYHELSRGNEMAGLVKDFPALERSILEPQSILSIVIVPIAVRDVFWGYMGFDDCHRGHDWMPSEIAALKTVANSFGGAFARRSAEAALQQVNESLEMRIQQRTAELEASMKLAKQASQAKTDFLANMSHELRTPLNGILGYAQIMQCSPALPAKERANISTIEQCGRHLLTLINDVLDHAKIESKKMDLFSTDVHFSSFIQAIVEMLDIQAKKKGISLSYEPSPQLPGWLVFDPSRLRQVLFNLINNAIKFTDKGEVKFRVRYAPPVSSQASASPGNVRIHFEVQDTGIGISPEHLTKIFVPFEQVGSVEKRSEGTGLGLAISRNIVTLMGGELKVQSCLGQGSLFSFEIACPEAREQSRTDSALKPSQSNITGYKGKHQKVLIVDDRWENRSVLSELLGELGFDCCEAEHGQQGLDLAMSERPDLIITDLGMPVMDGYEFLRLLRQQEIFQRTVVFISSASVFLSDQQRSLDAGGDYFLPKPIDRKELLGALEKCLNLDWNYGDNLVVREAEQALHGSVEGMASPPMESLRKLQKFANSGLISSFCNELNELEKENAKYQEFSKNFKSLAQEFKLKQIKDALAMAIANSA